VPAGRNPGLVLGAVLGEAYRNGRDKLTIITDQGWLPFGSWVEQLIAEAVEKKEKASYRLIGTSQGCDTLYPGTVSLYIYVRVERKINGLQILKLPDIPVWY
jgi:hypothetical protein